MPETLPRLLRWTAGRHGEKVFLTRHSSTRHTAVTFRELAERVRLTAAGLLACGIDDGDRVALISENRYEWLLADLGCASIGAIDVPRGVDTSPTELRFILSHSGCRFAFVENDAVGRELAAERASLPELAMICTLEQESAVPGIMTLAELQQRGRRWLAEQPGSLEARGAAVEPEHILTIVYTSGTTAQPKGVMLTHRNVLSNVAGCGEVLEFSAEDSVLSLLPAWHVYERMLDYVVLAHGAQLTYTDRRRFKQDLTTTRPTAVAAVPRVWEVLHDGIVAHGRKSRGLSRLVMQLVLRTCRRVGAGRAGPIDRRLHRALEWTLLPKIRKVTGGRLRVAVSGGGALPAHVDEVFLGLGLPLLNGYGLTETSPVVSVRRLGDNRVGTIGKPLPGTRVEARSQDGQRLPAGQTGVLWVQGSQVMKGYYRNAEKTAEVIDAQGWFNSGDLGCIEPDGNIKITGRAKDTIVLVGGENVEPEPLEAAIKTSDLVSQAVIVGQDRKHLGALLVVAPESLAERVPRARWAERAGVLHDENTRKIVARELNHLLAREHGFRAIERVKTFAVLLEPMTTENGLLTQTLKIKRSVVHQRYAKIIEKMYT